MYHAFIIKYAFVESCLSDPSRWLVLRDTKNDSFLKMDVRRVTRFASCVKFLMGLAMNRWEGKEIDWDKLGIPKPTAARRLEFLAMSKYAELIDIIFVETFMSYEYATFEQLEKAEKAFKQLLEWHLLFNNDFIKDQCNGAVVSRYQIEAMAGLLRHFRKLLTLAAAVNNETGTGGPKIRFKWGRLCNSYLEGRFSVFRCAVGNSVLDGASIR